MELIYSFWESLKINYKWIFSGVGGVIVVGVISFIFRMIRSRKSDFTRVVQTQKAGKESTLIQVAGNAENITLGERNLSDK